MKKKISKPLQKSTRPAGKKKSVMVPVRLKESDIDELVVHMSDRWNEFRESGLFHFVNSFLHMFHWSLVLMVDKSGNCVCVPRRSDYTGFSERSNAEAYGRVWKLFDTGSRK